MSQNATVRWASGGNVIVEEVELEGWQSTELIDGVLQVQAESGDIFIPMGDVSFARVEYSE